MSLVRIELIREREKEAENRNLQFPLDKQFLAEKLRATEESIVGLRLEFKECQLDIHTHFHLTNNSSSKLYGSCLACATTILSCTTTKNSRLKN